MSARFKFYFDAVEVSAPNGWEKMVENMSRDQDLKGIFITHDTPLEFTGDAYDFLWAKRNTGFCSQTEFGILESCNQDDYYEHIYQGVLHTADIEFTLNKCIAKVKINDNTFYAKINNNKNLDCLLTGGATKNLVQISAVTRQPLELFDPFNGFYYAVQNLGYKVYDVLAYLIAFMTDNEVEFDSQLFGVGGDYEFLALTNGYCISQIGLSHTVTDDEFVQNMQPIKYNKLFTELDKRLNLGFYFEFPVGGKPIIWIERYEDTKLNDVVINVPKIKEITAGYFQKKLYSSLKLGTTITNSDDPTLSFPETIRFQGFALEEYTILGKCNLDNPLDLQCDFVTSSNVIEKAGFISPSETTYDKEWFLIDCQDNGGNLKAKQSNWITGSPAPYFYNERFTNNNIALNHLGAVPNSIAIALTPTDNKFRAELSADTSEVTVTSPNYATGNNFRPIPCDDESTSPNNDPGNNYQTSSVANPNFIPNPNDKIYTAPVGGVYTFEAGATVHIRMPSTGSASMVATLNLIIERWDSSHNLLLTFVVDTATQYVVESEGPYDVYLTGAHSFNLNPGDYVNCYISTGKDTGGSPAQIDYSILQGAYFTCTATNDGGGVYQYYNPEDYPIDKYIFTYPLSRKDYRLLQRNILKAISFDDGRHYFKGWIDNLKYDLKTSEGKFTIISNGNRPILRCTPYFTGVLGPGMPNPQYGQINRNWPAGVHEFTLVSLNINGTEHAANQVLTITAPDDLIVGPGLDGLNYIQNVSDWINQFLPFGWKVYDNMMFIDYRQGSTFTIIIDYNDLSYPLHYGQYRYDNNGFYLPGVASVYAPYTCIVL